MGAVEQSIVVEEPIRTVYNQWTQFEEFPRFMEGVTRVQQLDDTHLRWEAEIAGQNREWEAEIIDQTPDQRIAWRTVSGYRNDGTVTFRPEGEATRINLRMEFETDDMMEKAGDALGIVESRVKGDLERFKDFIESRGRETGAWRGQV